MEPLVVFDNVSKKFRRGESHNSLRDLLPALASRLRRRRPASDALKAEEFWAVRNVSFTVSAGQALGIIGANGAGKSTTLKLLTRILRPTTGSCSVRGRSGCLIEVAAGFHPDLTGRENVFLQGAIMGMRSGEIRQRFDEIVEFAGVSAFVDTPVKRYSSGMNARLGFSIAVHLSPDVLIIDEVLSVGDMTFQQKCFDRMLEFKRDGVAIVLVSHNLQAVGSLCDNVLYLAGGVKAFGPASQVLEQYVRSSQPEPHSKIASTVRVSSVSFDDEGDGAYREVAAGTLLRLRLGIASQEDLDDVTFAFVIQRSTDSLVVYNGHVHRRELGPVSEFGKEFVLDFSFRANLTRGIYHLSLQVLHNPTLQFLIRSQQVATLAVRESRSREGVADVELSASLGSISAVSHRA